MNIEQLYKRYTQHYKVDTDTRTIRQNTIFFALKGANFNGNKYAKQALENGANYAVVDEKEYAISEQYILVDNVLKTLQKLANYHRNQLNIPIISLTGSNGKTTTKELINAVMSQQYETVATKGNLNNHIGVPLTLLSMKPQTEIGIVEMGANHQKEIEFLCTIAEPDFGYITNFGKAHLEGFGGIQGVIKGKTELYEYLKNVNKKVFINEDDSIQIEKSKGMNTIFFGKTCEQTQVEFLQAQPFVQAKYNDQTIQSNLIGEYNFNNIACAITIGKYFKISAENIKNAIENYVPTNNRSQIIEKGSIKIILDAYNANPSSMTVALNNFSKLKDTRKIAILGDMFELGESAEQEHQLIADLASSLSLDKVVLVGENFHKVTNEQVECYNNFEALKSAFNTKDYQEATLLIKGSRGMALERVLDLL